MATEKRVLRVVVDTNVILSNFLTPNGTAGRAFDFVAESHTYIMCAETLAELIAKLSEKKFSRYGTPEERMEFVSDIEERAEFVSVHTKVSVSIDPKDDIFLALAFDGLADFIVSGDKKHLLPIGSYEGIPIISPADFLARMEH